MIINPHYPLFDEFPTRAYLTFSSEDDFTIAIYNKKKNWNGTLYTSTDATTWTEWDGKNAVSSSNGLLYLRGSNNTYYTRSVGSQGKLVITATSGVNCSGNLETILDWETVENGLHPTLEFYGMNYMFMDCSALVSAPELLFDDVPTYALSYLFENCVNLVNGPSILPATTVASAAYQGMFYNCPSLVNGPSEISATTLYRATCRDMFYGCSSLVIGPEICATTYSNTAVSSVGDGPLYRMFYNCSSLVRGPLIINATSIPLDCCNEMFYGCSALTVAPALPAETIGSYCYRNMFYNCSSLTTAPALPATTLASACYSRMFAGCSSLITPPALPATTLVSECYYQMFANCSNLEKVPALPATTLATDCYIHMFSGCYKIKVYTSSSYTYWFRTQSDTSPYAYMFKNTTGSVTGTPDPDTNLYTSNQIVS